MPLRNPADLAETMPRRGALVGLDLGTKTIGVAASNPERTIASPRETIRRTKLKPDIERLLKLVDQESAVGVILGLPLNMDGSEGPRCQAVRQFAADLIKTRDLDVVLWDERLSTVAVTRTMIDADVSRARRAEAVDKLAAAYILEGFIDWLRARSSRP
ncbi:MAG TPA: Holliday junction resolvase RuvX [Alphaproteobacteria bacterium]|jgi:putative Holliday junction resolvase|nr:Holliday junction resolvase RuvX [Alphaproteobacteria bacterium]